MATFRLELPEVFTGEDGKDFYQWVKRYEVAVKSVDITGDQLPTLLPSRLAGSAFTVWDSRSDSEKKNFDQMRAILSEVFGRNTYLTTFRSCVTARVRLPSEPIEVFAATICSLVEEAFPNYDADAKEGEKFRRFVAGLDTNLQKKLFEHNAKTFKVAVETAARMEQAASFGQPTNSQAAIATVSATGYQELSDRIASMEKMMGELMAHNNRRQRSPSSSRDKDTHRQSRHSDDDERRHYSPGRSRYGDRRYERRPYSPSSSRYDRRPYSPSPERSRYDHRPYSPSPSRHNGRHYSPSPERSSYIRHRRFSPSSDYSRSPGFDSSSHGSGSGSRWSSSTYGQDRRRSPSPTRQRHVRFDERARNQPSGNY